MPSAMKVTRKRSANDEPQQDRKAKFGNVRQNLDERFSNLDKFKFQIGADGADENSRRAKSEAVMGEGSPCSSKSSSSSSVQRVPYNGKSGRSKKKSSPKTKSAGKTIDGQNLDAFELRMRRADSLPPMRHLGSTEQVKNIVKALKNRVDGKVLGITKAVERGGDDIGEYVVQRIMDSRESAEGLEFLVKWCGWNFTSCTWQSLADLKNSPIALKQFTEKEKALKKMFDSIRKNPQYARYKFQRFVVPSFNGSLTNEELEERMMVPHFQKRIGYWKTKLIELTWMDMIDPSHDLDEAPIYIESWLPRSKGMDFEFITESTMSPGAKALIRDLERKEPSRCKMGCSCAMASKCQRCGEFIQCKLGRNGLVKGLRANKKLGIARVLFPCSDDCPCSSKDKRVIKSTRPYPLLVFEDPEKGWCVRAVTAIPKGAIVSEYLGKIELESEVNDESYVFGLDNGLVNNARAYGNESRFFSHSCDPNMMVLRVYKTLHTPVHRFVMVTVRSVQPGEELTFDYHPHSPTPAPNDIRDGKRPAKGFAACKCSSTYCRKWV